MESDLITISLSKYMQKIKFVLLYCLVKTRQDLMGIDRDPGMNAGNT
jgi:hypothetical protein